jgi:hypothetical protein
MPFVYSIHCNLDPFKEYIGQTKHEDTQANKIIKFKKLQQWSFDGSSLIEEFDTIRAASEKSGTDVRTISRCCKGGSRSGGGFKWKILV